tara:strand:- start:926 stop:1060 length:135 start_codon:yes stop_codon:yes gene_type:complete
MSKDFMADHNSPPEFKLPSSDVSESCDAQNNQGRSDLSHHLDEF